jgi:DNA end-binding protein Ku
MPRAYWKGFLKLSLVSIPVEIFNAVESGSEISFRQIHKPSGRRINYEKVVQGIGKIDNADIVKGYEVDKDVYVTLDPEEIDAVKLDSKKTLELSRFVEAKDVDYRFFERPYFLTHRTTWPWKAMSSSAMRYVRLARSAWGS